MSEERSFRIPNVGRKAQVVSTSKSENLEAGKKRTIAVRVVDVFGNDAAATVEVDLT